MRMNRRRFLVLGSLSGVGLAFLGKAVIGQGRKPLMPNLPRTPSAASGPLRFVVVADAGSGDANQIAVGQAMSRYRQSHPFNLALMAGDNIYTNGEMEKIQSVFEHPYADLLKQGVEFRACLGNHDVRYQNGDLQVKYAPFHMEGRYYTYRKESVQFFVLDTNGTSSWTTQTAWLEKELAKSNAPWKIVYGHHPIYSSGLYGTNQEMVARLGPLFKKYRVQLYLNGHEHNYERTKSINGTTYLITGIGGATLRPIVKSAISEYTESRFGFSAIDVYQDHLEITGIGTDGQPFDHGVVSI